MTVNVYEELGLTKHEAQDIISEMQRLKADSKDWDDFIPKLSLKGEKPFKAYILGRWAVKNQTGNEQKKILQIMEGKGVTIDKLRNLIGHT